MFIVNLIQHHARATVGLGSVTSAMAYAVVDDATSSVTLGVGSAGALILAMVVLVFRTQQQQIRSQLAEMTRMGNRIEHLEAKLDELRWAGTM
ncbi:MAG: hypothetical protein ACKV2O_24275 [Acidimicrobiales bacterium]